MPQPNALRLVVWITLSSSLLGALFAYAENRPHGIADFVNTELHGVLAGGLNGGIPSSLEILGAAGRLRSVPPAIAVSTLPIPTKPPVYNGMIAPRDSWMMPPPCNEMIPPGAPRLLA